MINMIRNLDVNVKPTAQQLFAYYEKSLLSKRYQDMTDTDCIVYSYYSKYQHWCKMQKEAAKEILVLSKLKNETEYMARKYELNALIQNKKVWIAVCNLRACKAHKLYKEIASKIAYAEYEAFYSAKAS